MNATCERRTAPQDSLARMTQASCFVIEKRDWTSRNRSSSSPGKVCQLYIKIKELLPSRVASDNETLSCFEYKPFTPGDPMKHKAFALILPSILAMTFGSPAARAEMIEIGRQGPAPEKAFILKHPDATRGAAFVRTTDSQTLSRLIEKEGNEVVMCRDHSGKAEPVTGDIVPNEVVASEAEGVNEVKQAHGRTEIDMGVGLNLGFVPGGKARILATLPSGAVVGVDVDAGTLLFITEASISAIFGWSFEVGQHVIRPYVTVGGGGALLFAILAAAAAPTVHTGVGVEWKPARWFGLGIEGGVSLLVGEEANGLLPYARLTAMFYFL